MRKFLFCVVVSLAVFALVIVDKAFTSPRQAASLADDAASASTRTAVGPEIALAHGIVQVQVTCIGSRIIAVKALQLPHDNNHSWEDSLHAASVLDSEVLSKQTYELDAVSGATYTSEAYLQSLEAALDVAAPPAPRMSATPMG
ncbi:FMN-binding protein [Actinospica durhamensis]|uniref:FMN-binding protein n=1 Tax=Actinospica durhamensis TaxID=1508375 RepID=A0A941EKW6_9ACTN|nr:FMN-binding protein [Actinospica durhamensis]MBR7832402.1 FMN-binding protein [Actinospica durhamensis]